MAAGDPPQQKDRRPEEPVPQGDCTPKPRNQLDGL